jgi:hypothetical protein
MSSFQWISVKERVPGDRRRVLVVAEPVVQLVSRRAIVISRCNFDTTHGYAFDCEGGRGFPIRVTHWAELPDLPPSDEASAGEAA